MAVRIIAIDWSGAKKNAGKKIFWAEFRNGRAVCLENGRDRDQTIRCLVDSANGPDKVIVGLDFAFSCPAWFVRHQKHSDVGPFWDTVGHRCEEWLEECSSPFWGRRGQKCLIAKEQLYRRTELQAQPVAGIRPKSVFQLAGGGHVGTGSLRGMAFLPKLRESGFAIWPFDRPAKSVVIEIYPRLLTGEVKKNNKEARQNYLLSNEFQSLRTEWRQRAVSSEDAFDAAISAFRMNQHLGEIDKLQQATDAEVLLEGKIWIPQNKS
jgi:hypothetical protein